MAWSTRVAVSRPWRVAWALLMLAFVLTGAIGASGKPAGANDAAAPVLLLKLDGAVGPATADYLVRGIARAARENAQLVIIRMDTPGGLDTAMRDIIKSILLSPVPVATWVAPGGARAASAGTYILYASHIAAMAPGTNLGAATPVQLGAPGLGGGREKPGAGKEGKEKGEEPAGDSAMTHKVVNDAAAYIRGLAQLRGRNAAWAERAVREAVSLSADEAKKQRVIDVVAADVQGLAAQLDGRKVQVLGQDKTLHTKDATIIEVQANWREQLLAVITSPNLSLLLMTVGIYGLIFELMNPGGVLPGVLGAICLLLALYGLQLLPVNYAGLALILVGLGMLAAEAFLPSGVLGVGGIVAFIAGGLILIDTGAPGFGISTGLVITMAMSSALLVVGTATMAVRSRRRTKTRGLDVMVGMTGQVEHANAAGEPGWASFRGETWKVSSAVTLQPGQKVRVTGRQGLVLEVTPVEESLRGVQE